MKLKVSAVILVTAFVSACGLTPSAPATPEQSTETSADSAVVEVSHRSAVIAAVGDLMVHEEQLRDAYNAETGGFDFTRSFEYVSADISDADIAIGNLETVLAGEDAGYSGYPLFNAPDSFARTLKSAGFDFLSTANNHCMDMGEDGLLRTLEALDSLGLGHTGTFASTEERNAVTIREVNGIRVALVAFTYGTNGIKAAPDKPYLVNLINSETVRAALSAAKAQNADWIVALPHMGIEYESETREEFMEWVDFMIACGADMVLASHPHVLQPMEVRTVTDTDGKSREALVVYSMGNFLSSQREVPRETGMLLRVHIAKDDDSRAYLEKVTLLPTWVQLRDSAGRLSIRVLPVYDAVQDYERGNRLRLLPQDYTRLCEAGDEVTALYLGQATGRNGMRREYEFYLKSF